MTENKAYILPEMTWVEAEKAYKEAKIAIIPVGSHEQHGPGIKMKVDGVQAYELAKLVAQGVHPLAVVTPPVNIGISHHHMKYPGTVTLKSSTFMAVIEDIVTSLYRFGFKKFLIINAHGGNQYACNLATNDLKEKLGVEIAYTLYLDLVPELVERVPPEKRGHGADPGLAPALYLDEDLVYMDRLEKGKEHWPYKMIGREKVKVNFPYYTHEISDNGVWGDPEGTSKEFGKEICDAVVERLGVFIRDFVKNA
ncbi:MAG TPA: creatininase family protein [Bacillota bacterium]|nr:creatininase family protein [Clostridiaceae bacterium]HNR03220.1 creatininase family protein [Bacillota bacterium]HNT02979.1 creatininase family protein [Bacillota bacterium]HPA54097.1 creatininase family protein [Bacillota bacterium]HPX67785.1 creatininase family protein [Bacillota bacterium]